MPGPRLLMRKIRDVLRLTAAGMSSRMVAASLTIGATTVVNCLGRARRAGIVWPLPDDLSDETLEKKLFPPLPRAVKDQRPQPDWPAIHRELGRKGTLGADYAADAQGWRAAVRRLRRHDARRDRCRNRRDAHRTAVHRRARGVQLHPRLRGDRLYAEATWTQGLADWIGSHSRAFAFVGGVSAMVVSDNLKSGITKACFYEPAVNRSYAEMAAHYTTAIVPARPRKPRDKAKVEVAVVLTTRWIIAKLRNRRFFSLADRNAAIHACVADLNIRVSRHLGASRARLFEDLERPALKPLPAEPYVYAEWKECRGANVYRERQALTGLDYHVDIEKHYYSVPHTLLREKLWARITTRTVELFHRGRRVAAHVRSSSNRKHTTVREHMPSSHQRYADWTPECI